MKKGKTNLLAAGSLCLALLASCGNQNAGNAKWSYTKEDMSNFLSLEADLESGSDTTSIFSVDTNMALFSQDLSKDDVIVYDIDKAKEVLEEKGKDFADYSVLKEASLSISNIVTTTDKDGFKVTFASSDSANYGMLINSSVTSSEEYVMVTKRESDAMFASDPQAIFEENYLKSGGGWDKGGKFIYQIASNIGMILVGAATDSPTAVVSGVFGILGTLGDNFLSSGATIQSVMNQLKETDRKIDELSAKLEKNTQQLATEIIRTEALVDQTNLNTLNLAINDFATDCLSPINVFNRNLADEVGSYYKNFVNSSETVKLLLEKNSKDEYTSASLTDISGDSSYNFSLTIDNFSNAKAHLASHKNIVEEGFMDELDKDIDAAIEAKTDLPEGISKENLRGFVGAMIYEQFMKQYFSVHREKAQKYQNLVIEFAERILGSSGKISILGTYLSRLQCMYNFGSEIKPIARALAVNLMEILDMNTARAAEARLFAGDSYATLQSDYISAREAIQSFYKKVTDTPDSYSFTTSASLSGGFYHAKYNTSYSNLGNHCNLKVTFSAEQVDYKDGGIARSADDMSKHSGISPNQHSRIVTRWNLLRSSGATDSTGDYIHYLADSNVISTSYITAAEKLISFKEADSTCYRILTNDRTERDLHNTDASTSLVCAAQGNPDGDYFELGKTYNYSKTHTDSYWAGKTYEGAFMDASSGASLGTQKIATWARYAEDHWYWKNDEFWSFTNRDAEGYFFLIDIASAE